MLSRVHVRRVRSILDASMHLRPLTILVGSNGAGKSNIIRAIFLASVVSRRIIEEALPRWRGQLEMDPIGASEIYAYSSKREVRTELGVARWHRGHQGFVASGSITVEYDPALSKGRVSYRIRTPWQSKIPTAEDVVSQVANVRYISPDRLIRRSIIDLDDLTVEEEDTIAGGKLVEALRSLRRSKRKWDLFMEAGKRLFQVDWSPLLDDPTEMEFVDQRIGPSGVRLPFELTSLGTRQFFPILVHSLAAPKGGVLLTEEPEISLHPEAQVAAGEHLARMVGEGVQIILTTHSNYFLLGVCKQVRAGNLDADMLTILSCEKTAYGTKVSELLVDQWGRIDGWIPSFAKVDEYLLTDWIDSIPEAENGN